MAAGPRLATRQLGGITLTLGIVLFLALAMLRRDRPLFEHREMLKADFREVAGLREGSMVQLSGVEIGRVDEIQFAKVQYECNPLTEDVDRFGEGRTDDCDDFLFCAPNGLCADLERWAGKDEHPGCNAPEDCGEDEICVTGEFQRHAPKVEWAGPSGVCARFDIEHWRTRAILDVEGDKLDLIRSDSRAMVASNSVLGDQLVSINVGRGDPLDEDRRIQTRSSIYEDIERFRHRLDSITEKADISLAAMLHVINELKDERTMGALKGTLYHVEVITRDIAYGEGLIGALVNSPQYKRDVGLTVSALESTGRGLEQTVATSNRIMDTTDRNLVPVLHETEDTLEAVHGLLADLEDPSNRSIGAKLLRDPDGKLAGDLESLLDNTAVAMSSARSITDSVDDGKGTLGKLINDPTLVDDVGSLLSGLSNHGVIRWLFKVYLKSKGIDLDRSKDPASAKHR